MSAAEETGFRTQNPGSNTVEVRYDYVSDAELEVILKSVHAEFETWSSNTLDERAEIGLRIAELFTERREELAKIASTEMGKPLDESTGEADVCASIFRYYAQRAAELTEEEVISEKNGFKAILQTRPIGPLLGIMPWNFPYYQIARFAAPNLILGNTIVLKHAEICPQSALAVEQLFRDAGLPEGAYHNIFITHEQAEQVIADPRIQGVSLTGSERAGAAVAEAAGRNLKKVVLELGGSDAHIYLDSHDIRADARAAFDKRMRNMGQACTSNKRLLVVDDLFEDFLDEVTQAAGELTEGDSLTPEPGRYYPLSSERAAVQLNDQIQRAVEQGATLHAGGSRPDMPGAWVEPTVLSGITEEMDAYSEEFFGPVLMVYRVADADEAVAIANSSPYGLGGAVFAADYQDAQPVAERLDTGMTNVNVGGSEATQHPFGGVKRSGFGRELGPVGMDEFANKRLLYINTNLTR